MGSASKPQSDMARRILETATELFAARGFEATSLQTIADHVGLRKASLLYHFNSKEALRQAVLEDLLGRWNEVLPDLLKAATTGPHRYETTVREVLGFFADQPARARLLVREVLDHPDQMQSIIQSYFGPWIQLVSEYIRRGQKEGSVYPELDPEAYVVQVIHLILATVAMRDVETALTPEGARISRHDRQLDEMIRLARAGLFVDSPPHPNPSGA